ncbi:MAG: GDSL-type esterase/lipase family protein [Phycisphaerae bacterium]
MIREKHLRHCLAIVVLLSLSASCGLVMTVRAAIPGTRPAAVQDKWAKHYYDRVEVFRKENAAAKNIVMVGSSHIEGFDAARLLPGRRVVNRGIASDRIGLTERGILHRLDSSVFDCNPGFIILENGVNDLGELRRNGEPSINDIEACYRKVVKTIRDRLPNVPLVIVGLFPTRDRYAALTPSIQEFNKRLAKIAADHNCSFMDVFEPLADDLGFLRKEYSRDGLHLNEAGYKVWAKMIEKVLPPLNPASFFSAEPEPKRS